MGQVYHYKSTRSRVFIATPSRSGATAPAYQLSLIRTISACKEQGIGVEWCLLTGNCHVDDARNYLVRDFLLSDSEMLFFIDSDMGWNSNDFIKMVESEHDVVAGIYPKKREDQEYPVRYIQGELQADRDGWMEVDKVPTGFLRIKRHVLQAMYDNEERKFSSAKQAHKMPQAIIFERTYENGARISGDFSWSNKWRRMNGKIFVDPEMRFFHEGTKEFQGKLAHHLRKKNGLIESYIKRKLKKIESDDYSIEDILDIYEAWENVRACIPKMLNAIAMVLENSEIKTILDLGSGLTTLICGAIAKRKGIKIVSIEHSKDWYDKVHLYLNDSVDHKLVAIKDKWYDYKIEDDFDLVIVDGPPQEIGRHRINEFKFKKDCLFFVDDYETSNVKIDGVNLKSYDRFAMGVKR